MRTRSLGSQGLEVSALGLGCMGMSDVYGPRNDEESAATINHALDRGLTLLDTADIYGTGRNEELVGSVVRARRDWVVVATKFGYVLNPGSGQRKLCGRPEYVRQAIDASLRRTGLDVIDLYYQHRVDPEVPIEETVGAMAELVALARSSILASRRQRRPPFAVPTPYTRSRPCRRNTRCGAAMLKPGCCQCAANSA